MYAKAVTWPSKCRTITPALVLPARVARPSCESRLATRPTAPAPLRSNPLPPRRNLRFRSPKPKPPAAPQPQAKAPAVPSPAAKAPAPKPAAPSAPTQPAAKPPVPQKPPAAAPQPQVKAPQPQPKPQAPVPQPAAKAPPPKPAAAPPKVAEPPAAPPEPTATLVMVEAVQFSCSHCANVLQVRPEQVGMAMNCPYCQASLTVPTPAPPPVLARAVPVKSAGTHPNVPVKSSGSHPKPPQPPAKGAAPKKIFRFPCDKCKAMIQADHTHIGLMIVCPQCRHDMTVPEPA